MGRVIPDLPADADAGRAPCAGDGRGAVAGPENSSAAAPSLDRHVVALVRYYAVSGRASRQRRLSDILWLVRQHEAAVTEDDVRAVLELTLDAYCTLIA